MLDLARKHNFELNMAGAARNIGPILLQNFLSLQRSPDAETVKRWIKREMKWHQDEARKRFTAEVITTGNGPVGVGSDERSRARREFAAHMIAVTSEKQLSKEDCASAAARREEMARE